MKRSLLPLVVLGAVFFGLQVEASPAGSFTKQLSSFLKWMARASPRTPQSADGNVLQFENGYLVETIVERNKLGVTPHTICVSPEGKLFAVDYVNSNIVRITPPLSQYSRARLVAGSFQGYSGHVDGKPSEAKFNHSKGVTMDEKGNIYVADTSNLAIRKIGESGYIGTYISDGLRCLMQWCPDPTCGVAVDQDMINALVSGEDKVKYSRYLFKSYIEDNRKALYFCVPFQEQLLDYHANNRGEFVDMLG